jgi:hypothetical protein
MNEEIKDRFEQVDKRFDDFKTILTLGSVIITLIFGIISIFVTLNLQSEKASLREFEKELRDEVRSELGRLEEPAKVELYDLDQKPINGRNIPASFDTTSDGSLRMTVKCILRNEGVSESGPVSIKIYTSNPIKLFYISTDERGFNYEGYIPPKNLSPSELPGGLSIEMNFGFELDMKEIPANGTYPALFKLFYGKGKIAKASFNIIVRDS